MAKINIAHIRPGEGDVVEGGGANGVAVYRKQDGSVLVLSADCPHAHCDVVWNQAS